MKRAIRWHGTTGNDIPASYFCNLQCAEEKLRGVGGSHSIVALENNPTTDFNVHCATCRTLLWKRTPK